MPHLFPDDATLDDFTRTLAAGSPVSLEQGGTQVGGFNRLPSSMGIVVAILFMNMSAVFVANTSYPT